MSPQSAREDAVIYQQLIFGAERQNLLRPYGAGCVSIRPHGLRRGLHYFAASRLPEFTDS